MNFLNNINKIKFKIWRYVGWQQNTNNSKWQQVIIIDEMNNKR
jgi:hypothetical protein